MSNTSKSPLAGDLMSTLPEREPAKSWTSVWVFAATGLMFAVLQSVCTFFVALGAFRVLLGATALVAVGQFGTVWEPFHGDLFRRPMMIISVLGLLASWASLRRVRRLRENPASQWRRRPLTARQIRFERWQMGFQVATLTLLVLEEWMHLRNFHRF